jgi:hypothetical protein
MDFSGKYLTKCGKKESYFLLSFEKYGRVCLTGILIGNNPTL